MLYLISKVDKGLKTMNKTSRIIISIISLFLIILILLGLTYAYFLTQIKGNEQTKSISVTTANLRLVYGDGNGELIGTNVIKPGDTIKFYTKDKNGNIVTDESGNPIESETKTFTVTNEGNVPIKDYLVVVENVINNFSLREDLVYSLTCKSVNRFTGATSGSCSGASNISFPIKDSILVTNNIDKDIRHEYSLKIEFKESNTDQSIDMNKTLSAKINIYDRKEYITYLTDFNEVNNYISEIGNIESIADNYILYGPTTTEVSETVNSNKNVKVQFLSDTTYLIDKNTWLVFNSLSKVDYNTSSWTEVAGPIDNDFITELSKKGIDLNKYKGLKYLATENGEYAGIIHFSAALVAKIYNTDALVNLIGYTEEEFDDLAGWAGDLQTLIGNNLISQISDQNNYNEIYSKMSELIGKTGTYFDSDDLYADIDAVNLFVLLKNNNTKTIKEIMTNYFTTQYKNRFSMFIKNLVGSLDYNALREYIYHYTEYSSYWKLYSNSFSTIVAEAAADAFTDYLWFKANNKELNIFTESLEFKKGTNIEFRAEYIDVNNQRDINLLNSDFTWDVTNVDGSKCNSTINNGILSISSEENVNQLLITVYLTKSNKTLGTKVINLT